ncbi:MAG: hypothetical protein GY953_04555, partial [bacterium]|nr:hypothetical protein [bacterium]
MVVDQALLLIGGVYVHLPTMRDLYAVNPVARLELLKRELPELSEHAFQARMIDVFRELRDPMARYIVPPPYQSAVAFLPFQLGAFWEKNKRRYEVTQTLNGFVQDGFGRGAEVTRWNGMPMEWAALDHAQREPASNNAARFAFGLESMTKRPLTRFPFPEEAWVSVVYQSGGSGEEREILLPWNVMNNSSAPSPGGPFHHRIIDHKPPVGYLRIERFTEAGEFVSEFARILDRMSKKAPRALIIDLRGNPGGPVDAAEKSLQLLTPRTVEPMFDQILNTPVTRQIAAVREDWKRRWGDDRLDGTGAVFSPGDPSSTVEALNALGQRYHGRVLLLVDARSAGAAEIFAGSFQDHEAGVILGVDESTAGAVGEIEHHAALAALGIDGLVPLPTKTRMFVPAQRSIRVGRHAGDLLDDEGVKPDRVHRLSRRDLSDRDDDLMRK